MRSSSGSRLHQTHNYLHGLVNDMKANASVNLDNALQVGQIIPASIVEGVFIQKEMASSHSSFKNNCYDFRLGTTESWANNDITDADLGLEGYVMFRKDRIGRRRGGVLLYIKETIPAYEVQLLKESDCNEAIWCKLVKWHSTVTIGVVYRCPNITK